MAGEGDTTSTPDVAPAATRRVLYLTERAAGFRQRAEDLRKAERILRDVPEGSIAPDVALILADIETAENNISAYFRRCALEVVADDSDGFVGGGEGIRPEVRDFIESLDDDEATACSEERVRLRIRQVDEMKKVWRHLDGVDQEDFRALDTAVRGYFTPQRFGEPVAEACELLEMFTSRDWDNTLERMAANLDAKAASLQT